MADTNAQLAAFDGAGILSLVELIQSSVTTILSEYKRVNRQVPSLECTDPKADPFYMLEDTTSQLRRAIKVVQASCAQLSASVASPSISLMHKGFAVSFKPFGELNSPFQLITLHLQIQKYHESSCLQAVVRARVADHLSGHPGGLHISDLSKRTNIDGDKLGRILRLLSTKHVFCEKRTNVFANNRLSIRLRADDTLSPYINYITEDCFRISPSLYDALSDRSENAASCAFESIHKMNYYDYLKTPEGQERLPLFANAMKGYGDMAGKNMLSQVYPWSSFPQSKEITICDVGGASGHVLLALLQTLPSHSFKAVVQDLPGMITEGKKLWAEHYPQAVKSNKVDFVELDFFKGSPVPGSDFYYLRMILHNWPDEKALVILKNVAHAMKAKPQSSKLFIHDFVLHPALLTGSNASMSTPRPGVVVPPPPLLSNFGEAAILGYDLDILMMNLLDAKDRTLDEMVALASKAGLKFERSWEGGLMEILEFSLA